MTRHRVMTQIKEEEKKTEKQLNDLKIINFHKKVLRLMIVKMAQEHGNKLEAKRDKLQENPTNRGF